MLFSPELTGHECVTTTATPSLQATQIYDILKNPDHSPGDIMFCFKKHNYVAHSANLLFDNETLYDLSMLFRILLSSDLCNLNTSEPYINNFSSELVREIIYHNFWTTV